MSQLMVKYISAYLAWAEDGAPNCITFGRYYALCANTIKWCWRNGHSLSDARNIREELNAHFRLDGLNVTHPFGGYDRFKVDSVALTHHKNELRLAWIRDKIAAYNNPEN